MKRGGVVYISKSIYIMIGGMLISQREKVLDITGTCITQKTSVLCFFFIIHHIHNEVYAEVTLFAVAGHTYTG